LHTTLEGTHFSFLSLKTLPCHLSSHHDNGWWGRLAQLLGNGEGRHEEVYSTCTQNTNASLTRKIIQIWYALGYKDGTILSKQTITSRLSQLNLWLQNLNDKNFVKEQQGDALATQRTIMNHLFSEFIETFGGKRDKLDAIFGFTYLQVCRCNVCSLKFIYIDANMNFEENASTTMLAYSDDISIPVPRIHVIMGKLIVRGNPKFPILITLGRSNGSSLIILGI